VWVGKAPLQISSSMIAIDVGEQITSSFNHEKERIGSRVSDRRQFPRPTSSQTAIIAGSHRLSMRKPLINDAIQQSEERRQDPWTYNSALCMLTPSDLTNRAEEYKYLILNPWSKKKSCTVF
jgi:hypothetical protein